MRATFAVCSASLLLLNALPVQAGPMDTVRIVIAGGDLATPIEVTDQAVTRTFEVWSGPGTFRSVGADRVPIVIAQGFIVDWSRGVVVDPPKGVHTYDVSFVTTRHDPGTYVVRYAIDPSTNLGYVYLPGKADSEYRDNTYLIYRGNEGNWFHAWGEWEKLAHPLIAGASKVH